MIIKQETYCYRCGKTIEVKERKKRTSIKTRLASKKLCSECLLDFKKQRRAEFSIMNKSKRMRDLVSRRMTDKNPMLQAESRNKVSSTMKIKYAKGEIVSPFAGLVIKKKAQENSKNGITDETRQATSDRMKKSNPMFREEVRDQVKATLTRKYANGEIPRITGHNHWLWKGTSSFNKTIRTRLYRVFSRPVMERDDYTCTVCFERGGILHSHHIVPLRDIIDKVLSSYEIDDISELVGEPLYDELVEVVVSCHEVKNGRTVCPKCHGEIDDRYRRKHAS